MGERKQVFPSRDERRLKVADEHIGELAEQTTTLTEQLKRHGGHTKDCACREPYITKTGAIKEVPKCDCGWAEIVKGWDDKRRTDH